MRDTADALAVDFVFSRSGKTQQEMEKPSMTVI